MRRKRYWLYLLDAMRRIRPYEEFTLKDIQFLSSGRLPSRWVGMRLEYLYKKGVLERKVERQKVHHGSYSIRVYYFKEFDDVEKEITRLSGLESFCKLF